MTPTSFRIVFPISWPLTKSSKVTLLSPDQIWPQIWGTILEATIGPFAYIPGSFHPYIFVREFRNLNRRLVTWYFGQDPEYQDFRPPFLEHYFPPTKFNNKNKELEIQFILKTIGNSLSFPNLYLFLKIDLYSSKYYIYKMHLNIFKKKRRKNQWQQKNMPNLPESYLLKYSTIFQSEYRFRKEIFSSSIWYNYIAPL
jgi:hypothetical protein